MARYLGMVSRPAAPVARPEHADKSEARNEAASEAVDERL